MTGLETFNKIKTALEKKYGEEVKRICFRDNEILELETIEKELKALEIIKEKRVDIGWLIRSKNCSKYNLGVGESQALKKTEYDLLKEVLK